jgi:hypothetical protein
LGQILVDVKVLQELSTTIFDIIIQIDRDMANGHLKESFLKSMTTIHKIKECYPIVSRPFHPS